MYITTEGLAKRLQVTEETVRRWYRSGKLKGKCVSKKKGIIFDERDVLRFIEDNPKYKNSYIANDNPVSSYDAVDVEIMTSNLMKFIQATLRNEKL